MCRECRMTKEASKNLIVIGQLLLAITLAEVRDREARSPAREGACAPQSKQRLTRPALKLWRGKHSPNYGC